MSPQSFCDGANIRRIFQKRKFVSDFFHFNVFLRLFELDDAEIVLVVDNDTIAMKLAGLACALPKQVFL